MGNLISLVCPSCGGKLKVAPDATSLLCQHCGNQHIVRHEAGAITLEAHARCPTCGRNDKSEKVSAVLARESHEITGMEEKTETILNAQGKPELVKRNVPFARRQVSILGQRLALPPEPQMPFEVVTPPKGPVGIVAGAGVLGLLGIFIGITGVASGAIFLLNAYQGKSPNLSNTYASLGCSALVIAGALAIVIWAVLWGIVGGRKAKRRRGEYESRLIALQRERDRIQAAWKTSLRRWDQLYYCSRDDCVFIPGEGTSAPASNMSAYLAASPSGLPEGD